MSDLLLAPPKPLSAEAIQAAIEAARKKAQEEEERRAALAAAAAAVGDSTGGAEAGAEAGAGDAKRETEGAEGQYDDEEARRRRELEEAEARRRKQLELQDEAKRAADRFKQAKKEGEDIVLGFSIKDETFLEDRSAFRRRLFPIGFTEWAQNVHEISEITAKTKIRPAEIVIFCVFLVTAFSFAFSLVPKTVFHFSQTIHSALFETSYFPYRTQLIEEFGNVTLVEGWETLEDVTSIDKLESWIYQVRFIRFTLLLKQHYLIFSEMRTPSQTH